MEYLAMAAGAIAAWLFFFPRNPRRSAAWLLLKPALVGGVIIAGWLALSALRSTPRPPTDPVVTASIPHERRTDQTMDYAQGDEELRALLSQ